MTQNTVKTHQRDTWDIIQSAVEKAVNLAKPTYGPSANKVLISKVTHKMIVDDGVQIMRDLELEDPAENAVLQIVRQVAVSTNDRVGDGTTSSLIMLQAIIREVANRPGRDGAKIEKELKAAFAEAKVKLLASAKMINTKEDLRKVAMISFDNADISKVIADTWYKVGKDGIVTIDRSGTTETFADITEGITMNRGYISPYMITNQQRMEGVIEKPYILLTDYRLTETGDILPIMNKLVEKQISNLVLICDNIENSALATAIINKVQGKFNLIAINLPAGDKQIVLEDMGNLLGAKVFSEKKGDRLQNAEIKDLGRAGRFIARAKESIIIGPGGKKSEVDTIVKNLYKSMEGVENQNDREAILKRIATYTNKVTVIKIGAATPDEERALRYKVEDSVNAVRAAFRGGVVCGGGLALARLKTSSEILNAALQAPFRQLKLNMSIEKPNLSDMKADEAVNVVSGEIGKFIKVGVIDPVDVLIAGIESAVSIASLLITTKGMIVEQPKHIPQEHNE